MEIGDRVMYSDAWFNLFRYDSDSIIQYNRKSKRGNIIGFSKNGELVKIKWDLNKTPDTYHKKFIKLSKEEPRPIDLAMAFVVKNRQYIDWIVSPYATNEAWLPFVTKIKNELKFLNKNHVENFTYILQVREILKEIHGK